jgi:competence protein ComGC
MTSIRNQQAAFTRIEFIFVVATIAVLAACLLPALARARPQAHRLSCANNLKQVVWAMRTFAIDHYGNMPMSLSASQGGSSEDGGVRQVNNTQAASRGVCKMFLCLSNRLTAPKILFCPAEYETQYRQAATTFAPTGGGVPGRIPYTNDMNVSYFIGIDAYETRPRMLLTGDHNLGGNANPPTTAYLAAPATGTPFISAGTNFAPNLGPAFLNTMHAMHGNLGMVDGSVDCFNRSKLQDALKSSGDTGRAAGNFSLATGSTGGAGCNRIQLP